MNIFVIGKSAGAQSFIELLSKSKYVDKIFCAPANPAIAEFAQCVNISLDDLTGFVEFVKANNIDITIPFDEYVIQNGIADIFTQENLKIFAPSFEASQVATSRAFFKKFIYKQKIPSPKYGIFDREASAIDYLKKSKYPVVIKYDHFANQDAFICAGFSKAKQIVEKVFFDVGKKVIIEEFSEGEIFRLSLVTDGYNVIPFPYVKEYDRALDGDNGEITKGVGAYAPFTKISSKLEEKIAQKIVFPLLDGLQNAGIPYIGFLSMKMVLTPNGDAELIECSPLPSVPEAVCAFQMIENDFIEIIKAAINGALEDIGTCFNLTDDTVVTTALLSGNYPDDYCENQVVSGIEDIDEDNIGLYYNDVGINSLYEISTIGGRAFFMSAKAGTLNKAADDLYSNTDKISFNGMYYRKDIGKTAKLIHL